MKTHVLTFRSGGEEMDSQYAIILDLWLFIRLAVSCYFFSVYILWPSFACHRTHWLSKLLVLTRASNRWPLHRLVRQPRAFAVGGLSVWGSKVAFFNSDFHDLSRLVAACSPLANFFTSETFQYLYLVRIVQLLQIYLNIVHLIHSFIHWA